MKVRASLRSAKVRDKNCQIVKRKGKLYVINKGIHVLRYDRDNLSNLEFIWHVLAE